VTTLAWDRATSGSAPAQLRVPTAVRDLGAAEVLTLRLAPQAGARRTADLRVSLVDGGGREASVRLSEVSSALAPLPGGAGGESSSAHKTLLRTAEVPLSRFRGVDLRDVRQVRLTAASPTGSVLLSDLAAVGRGAGRGSGPTRLPQVSLDDVVVDEGNGRSTAMVPVRLSAPSRQAVRVHLETQGGWGAGSAGAAATEVVLAPGSTCAVFRVPVQGDRRPGSQATTSYGVTAAVPVAAVTGDAHALLTVVEDDGVVVGGRPVPGVPPVGPQGDPCA
jgi:hypothetical protein